MKVEEDYQDVLQNLEGAIMGYYRSNEELIDAEVETALDWLIKIYGAEAQGKSSSQRVPKGTSGEVAEVVKQMCEFRLGREEMEGIDESGNPVKGEIPAVEAVVIVECLKRLKASVKLWSKKGGRQGYLDFIAQFFPINP